MHLADAFIQSDLQYIQAIHFLSVSAVYCRSVSAVLHSVPVLLSLFPVFDHVDCFLDSENKTANGSFCVSIP